MKRVGPCIDYEPVRNEWGKLVTKEGKEVCGMPIRGTSLWCGRTEYLVGMRKACPDHRSKYLVGLSNPKFGNGLTSVAFDNYMKDFLLGPYWRALPKRMEWGVKRNLDDPDALKLEHELALIRERTAELLQRSQEGESGYLWKLLKETFATFKVARRSGDTTGEEEAISKLDEYITQGTADYQAWEEIAKQVDRTKTLVEAEQKRELQENLLAPAAQAVELIKALALAVRECVEDQKVRDAVQRKFDTILESRIARRERNALVFDQSRGPIQDGEITGTDL